MHNVESAFVIDSAVLRTGGIASFGKSTNVLATSMMLCLSIYKSNYEFGETISSG